MIPPAFLAGVVSACVAYLDVVYRLRHLPAWRSLMWLLCRMVVEGGVGYLAFPIVMGFMSGSPWFGLEWGVLVSGLFGSAVIRSQLTWLGAGQEVRALGVAGWYQKIYLPIDSQIVELDMGARERWIEENLIECVSGDLDGFADAILSYFRSRHLVDSRFGEIEEAIEATLRSQSAEGEKIRTLAWIAISNWGLRFLRGFVKRGHAPTSP